MMLSRFDRRGIRSAEQVSRVGSIIAILALQVAALPGSEDTQETDHVLDRLLTLAEPEGYIRVFLDAGAPMYQALQAWLYLSMISGLILEKSEPACCCQNGS
jgi:LuxR family maltose regulon positive regulatory protein